MFLENFIKQKQLCINNCNQGARLLIIFAKNWNLEINCKR